MAVATVPAELVTPLRKALLRRFAAACEEAGAGVLRAERVEDPELLALLGTCGSLLLALHGARSSDPATLGLDRSAASVLLAPLGELRRATERRLDMTASESAPGADESTDGLGARLRAVCELTDAVRAIADREPARACETSADAVSPADRASASRLTPRETDVLAALSAGRSYGEIAAELYIDLETVRTHARRVRRKLGARTSRELAGFLDPSPLTDLTEDK